MISCPNSADKYTAANSSQGLGGSLHDLRNTASPAAEHMNTKESIAQEAAAKEEQINNIRDSIGRDATIGPKATAKDKAAVRGMAARETKWFNESVKAQRKRYGTEWNDWFSMAVDSTVGKASKVLDITIGVSKRFLHHGAWFDKWATLWGQQKDRSLRDNYLIQEFHAAPLRIQAVRQRWTKHTNELMHMVRPIAQRIGFSDQDTATLLGDYALARHVPEANAHLLKTWQEEIDIELAKPMEERDITLIVKNREKLESLQANIDNAIPDRGVWSCGFTNAQALDRINKILGEGITREEAEAFSNKLVELNNTILQERIDAGLVRPEEIARFPGFQFYVPIHSERQNTTGLSNDARGYNPGRYHKSEGMQAYMDTPDSAFWSTLYYAGRAASEIGMKDFSLALAATATAHKSMNRNSGLRIASYDALQAMQRSDDPSVRSFAHNFESMGGVVLDAPITKRDGTQSVERVIVYFDHAFKDEKLTGLTGAELNKALGSAPRLSEGLNRVALLTSWTGQMFTRAQPPFAVINSGRDVIERSFHLASSDMFNSNGEHVSGMKLLFNYFLNVPRSTKMLLGAMSGKFGADSKGAMYFNEYEGYGLRQQYTEGMKGEHKTLVDMISNKTDNESIVQKGLRDPKYKQLRSTLYGFGNFGKAALNTLDSWNDYFNNIASFNHYVTLREAGVSAKDASNKVMQSMNLSQTGDYTPALRMLYPFTKPTFQSSAAMMRTLGFTYDPRGFFHAGKNGWKYMAGVTLSLMTLRSVIDDSLGEDENGNSRLDNIPLGDLARYIPIAIDGNGNYIKFPLGYGPVQVAATLAYGWDRVERGLLSPGDFASEMLFSWVKNTTPGNWPAYDMSLDPADYIVQAFAPTILDPLVELATNRTYFGAELRPNNLQPFEAAADSGRSSTPREFHNMARGILQSTGVDASPEQVKAFFDGIMLGPLKVIQTLLRDTGVWESDPVYKKGAEATLREESNPYLAAFGSTQWFGKVSNVGRGMYYQAMDHYTKRVKEAGVKLTSANKDDYARNDPEAKRQFQINQLSNAGFSPEEIDDIILLYETRGKIGQLNSAFSQDSKRLWLQAESSHDFRVAFDELANTESELYNQVVEELNYYRESR